MKADKQHIIIAGAGCAGLALASELLRCDTGGLELTVIDPGLFSPVSKTWAFWGQPHRLAQACLRHSWDSMRVAFPGSERHERLAENRYHCLQATDFRQRILDELKADPRARLVQERVTEVHDLGRNEGVFVQTASRTAHCRFLFQSFKRPTLPDRFLQQHFVGWEVVCEKNNFNPSCFTLMDFDVDQDGSICFFYTLPFSRKHALVECTTLTSNGTLLKNHDLAVYRYLKNQIRGGFRRVRRERGTIPMTTQPLPSKNSDNVFAIGAVSGMTKASSGYTFQRSLLQATHLAESLVRDGTPAPLAPSAARFRRYDTMFLRALLQLPAEGQNLFRQLFFNNRFSDVLSFLAEETTLAQELRMLSRLPWRPILAPATLENARPRTTRPQGLPHAVEAV